LRFLDEVRRAGLEEVPALFGVFYYRSANPNTLETLSRYLPVPAIALKAAFAAGASPVDICANTIRTMLDAGARHFYISNLPLVGTSATLNAILERAGVRAGV
jgi:hypothetical protein